MLLLVATLFFNKQAENQVLLNNVFFNELY